jgi:hypothetical protein
MHLDLCDILGRLPEHLREPVEVDGAHLAGDFRVWVRLVPEEGFDWGEMGEWRLLSFLFCVNSMSSSTCLKSAVVFVQIERYSLM